MPRQRTEPRYLRIVLYGHGVFVSSKSRGSHYQNTRVLASETFVDTFELLQQQVPPELEPIADYVEDNYIGRPQRRGRRPPRFPIDFWNIHDRIADGLPRTNNSVEGFHRHIQASILCCHPNIWTFLKVLQKEQALNEIQICRKIWWTRGGGKRRGVMARVGMTGWELDRGGGGGDAGGGGESPVGKRRGENA